jgi:hypothetical protein
MKWTIKLVFEAIPGSPVEHEVGIIDRAEEISPAIMGLTIAEGKALLAGLQKQIVTAQVQQHVASIKSCPRCGKAFRTKGYYHSTLRSVYGSVDMRIRRLSACPCSGSLAQSFSTLFTNKSPITPRVTVSHGQDGCSVAVSKGRRFPRRASAFVCTGNCQHRSRPNDEGGQTASEIGTSLLLLRRTSPAKNW